MKAYNRFVAIVVILFLVFAAGVNLFVVFDMRKDPAEEGRFYRVEISRLEQEIASGTPASDLDLSSCENVTEVTEDEGGEDFFKPSSDYEIREINGKLYRFSFGTKQAPSYRVLLICDTVIAVTFLILILVLLFIRKHVILPLDELGKSAEELSKGNLQEGVKAGKSKYLGRMVWGLDLLRDKLESDRKRNRELEKEEKTLLLSLSHDIKTPLSAIKLSAKALSSGLYEDEEKKIKVAEGINAKADEIERYMKEITGTARDDVQIPDVKITEFYLSELLGKIKVYYEGRYEVTKTKVVISEYADVLISGDLDRAIEVLQNLIENGLKYGTGGSVDVSVLREENCCLVNVRSFGNPVSSSELPHVFDSFWRGSNSSGREGSGLGLYICRRLMRKMSGDVYADVKGESVVVTAVFPEA